VRIGLRLQVKGLESSAPGQYGAFFWAPWRIQGFLLPERWRRVLQWYLFRDWSTWPCI
jgi:hypothetical protein